MNEHVMTLDRFERITGRAERNGRRFSDYSILIIQKKKTEPYHISATL